jgi:hypothetical protein
MWHLALLLSCLAEAAEPAPTVALRATIGAPFGLGATASLYTSGFEAEAGVSQLIIIVAAWGRAGPTYVVREGRDGAATVTAPMLGYTIYQHAHDDRPTHGATASVNVERFFPSRGRLRANVQGTAGVAVFPGAGFQPVLPELRVAAGVAF